MRRTPAMILFLTVSLCGLGATPPEIIRVRVPADQVGACFPTGTDLKVLDPDRFESLVKQARDVATHKRLAMAPQIVQARHHARWKNGVLHGETVFALLGSGVDRTMLPLTPWTPAIRGNPQLDQVLGLSPTGKACLWVDPSTSTISFDWELVARPESRGRGFTLGLPGDDASLLVLDLPRGWSPFGPAGSRVGPLPIESDPRFSRWEFVGSSGLTDLRIQDPADPDAVTPGGRLWVGGETRIDLRGSGGDGRGIGNWSTEWTVESARQSPITLTAELDAGLELIAATGPGVDQVQQWPTPSGTHVAVTFSNGMKTPTRVEFTGHANVPVEGSWNIPAIRPVDAVWTRGMTSVTLDDRRVVSECRERQGRRIASPPIRDGRSATLIFESSSPTSPAELVFRKPRVESSCVVVGELSLGQSAPVLECRLKWTMHRGAPPELSFDMSPTWIPDRVQLMGLSNALVWHSSIQGDGGTRVTVLVPPGIGDGDELTLILGATSTVPGGRGNMDLPRIRPVKSATVDECWTARIDSSLRLEPVAAVGVAWVDPFLVSTFDQSIGFPDLTSTDSKRVALAWRWTEDNAVLRAARESVDLGSAASVLTHVKLARDGKSLILNGRISCDTSEPLKTLPIWLPSATALPADWLFRLDDPIPSRQRRLELTPIDRGSHAGLGFPQAGVAWKLHLPTDAKARTDIHFQTRLAWAGNGIIPLLSLPKSHVPRSLISVEVPRDFLATLTTDRMRNLNPSTVGRVADDPGGDRKPAREGDPSATPILHTLSYSDPTARLSLITEKMEAKQMPPIVREATLATAVGIGGRHLNRLRLLVQSEEREMVDFTMPDNSSLVRVLVDGAVVDPIRKGPTYSVPLPVLNGGAATTNVAIDFLTDRNPLGTMTRLRPELPRLQLPCLSFLWEIHKPPGWQVLNPSRGLSETTKGSGVRWPFDSLGLYETSWLTRDERNSPPSAELLKWLEEKLESPEAEDLTLTECFARWDAGPRPIIIDRVALMASGLGPKSILRIRRGDAPSGNALSQALRELGITPVTLETALLITSPAGTSDVGSIKRLREAVLQAIAWGADQTDRFQTVDRWRGEISPRARTEGEPAPLLRPAPGWTISRLSTADWPEQTASIEIVDEGARIAWGSWTGLLTAVLFLALGGGGSRKESIGVSLLLSACTLLFIVAPDRYEPFLAGGFAASLAILIAGCFQTGRRRRPAPRPSRHPRPSSPAQQSVHSAIALLAVGLTIPSTAGWGASPGPETSEPIIALIPFEGAFDPSKRGDRVILRLKDFQRLEELARSPEVSEVNPIRATSVIHRVLRTSRQDALIETEYELLIQGGRSAALDVLVAGTHQISATLDGVETPILIRPNGRQASIAVEGEGTHQLIVKRYATLQREATVSRLLLPVDRFPSARIEVYPPREAAHLEAVSCRGTTSMLTDGRTAGLLGPVEQLDVTWRETLIARLDRTSPSVDGLMLWDIEPAGDRIRARFSYHGVQRLAKVRFKIDPALIPRSIQCPGFVDVRREQKGSENFWTIHIDPPLTNHATVGLEFWRPAASDRKQGDAEPLILSGPETNRRMLAQFEPVDVERFSGAIGVRRPSNWTGRLSPLPGVEPITDETFVKLWGELPPEPLTLAGITRFVRSSPIELRTGPAVERIKVRPSADFQISSGRIAVNYQADFTESLGTFNQAVLELPAKFSVVEVDAAGLTDWSVAPDHRLHLRFDRPAPSQRRLRIRGWIPIDEKPRETGAKRLRAPTPWIRWLDVDAEPGLVNIDTASKPTIEGGDGLKFVSFDQSNPESSTDSRYRFYYRVEDTTALGEIVWNPIPPRLTVSIDSQAIVHQDWAEWTAILRYDVIGGALSTLNLELPGDWAAEARIQLPGNVSQITKITNKTTNYTINPERPVWGSQRLILRAEKPLSQQPEFKFPDVTPLGRGVTDTFLNLVNATGEPFRSRNMTGLQEIGDLSHFLKGGFKTASDDPNSSTTYHVQTNKWFLDLQLSRASSRSSHHEEHAVGVDFADVRVTETADRSILGDACYHIVPGGGWFLPITMPADAELIFVSVDQDPVTPFRSEEGRWMVPIEKRQTRSVRILWRDSLLKTENPPHSAELSLPKAGTEPVSTTVRFNASGRLANETESSLNRLVPITAEHLELIRATAIAERIHELLGVFDRGSFRDREALVSLLVSHEFALRDSARNATRRVDAPNLPSRPGSIDQNLASITSARERVAEAIQAAGLTDVAKTAQAYLGQNPENAPRPGVNPDDSSRNPRIREIGTPTFYHGINLSARPNETHHEPFYLRPSFPGSRQPGASFVDIVLLCIPLVVSILLIFPSPLGAAGWSRLLGPASLLVWTGWFGGGAALVVILMSAGGFGFLRARIERMAD